MALAIMLEPVHVTELSVPEQATDPTIVAGGLEGLLKRSERLVWKVCRAYAPDADDAADLYQDVMLQVVNAWPRFRGQSQPSTYVYRIALNVALSYVRQRDRRRQRVQSREELPPMPGPDPHHDAMWRERAQRFYAALEHLPGVDKALVLMHAEGFDHAYIAEVLGISEGNARVKLSRSVKKLKQLLAE